MIESIYHMTLKLVKNPFLACKSQDFAIFTQRYNERHNVTLLNMLITSILSIVLHGIISLPDAM